MVHKKRVYTTFNSENTYSFTLNANHSAATIIISTDRVLQKIILFIMKLICLEHGT